MMPQIEVDKSESDHEHDERDTGGQLARREYRLQEKPESLSAHEASLTRTGGGSKSVSSD
jgi:hypothetical protein